MEKVYLVLERDSIVRAVCGSLSKANEVVRHIQCLYGEEDACDLEISVFEVL